VPPALLAASAPVVFLEKLAAGGATMFVLAGLSLVGLACGLERLLRFRRDAFLPPDLPREAARLWAAGDWTALAALPASRPSTFARAVAFLAENRRDPRPDAVVAEAGELCSREIRLALQRAMPLSVVATLSPLVGLFGTVLGMIIAFDQVALVGELGDPAVLAGGISIALVTTAAGLVIAVPGLALHHWIKSRAHLHAIALEQELSRLARAWFSPAPADHENLPR
jgi:biopolymer transport protein ExbB